jgi:hypothetical protein
MCDTVLRATCETFAAFVCFLLKLRSLSVSQMRRIYSDEVRDE